MSADCFAFQAREIIPNMLGSISGYRGVLVSAVAGNKKMPRGRPSPGRRAEENEKKEAETGGSG